MSIGERLRRARQQAGFSSARAAALAFGWSVSTYASHENGQTETPPIEALARYARAFRVPVEEITFGALPRKTGLAIDVPIISWVAAGRFAAAEATPGESAEKTPQAGLPRGQWIALRVEGDSMDRISPPGSTILVNAAEKELVPQGLYVIATEDGESTYKRYRSNPDRFEPVSFNGQHEPLFPNAPIRVIGRVRRTLLDL